MNAHVIREFEGKDIFRILFESAGEGLVLVDKNGTILMVNPRVEELFQYTGKELIGRPIEILIPDRLREKHVHYRESYNQKPKKRSMGAGMDLQGQRKDGTTFSVEISLNYFRAGDELLIMGLITNITERKNIERELQQLNIELEERVMQRTRELAEAIRELEYTNKSLEKAQDEVKGALEKEKELSELKSRFVSTASHEFRTPLTTILSSLSLIGKYVNPEDTEKREKHISRIKSAVNNLKDILNDFLSVEKLEEGKVANDPVEINLTVFLKELVEELSPICKPGQQIQHKLTPDNITVSLDPKLLKNVLLNLISNAIKFSPEDSTIQVAASQDKKGLTIEIIDQGIGIGEEDQEHLFERFFRAKNSINIQGTGLGLNIVKKYLELMGGTIHFHSELNKGTTFIIRFPATK
jgi:PAS domain S-box-containing protein